MPASQQAVASVPRRPPLVPGLLDAILFKTLEGVGSEGYGPHIQRVASEGTSAQAMQALRTLWLCRHAHRNQELALEVRATQPPAGQAALTGFAIATGEELRRCQTVTPEVEGLRTDLALKALRGGELGAANELLAIRRSAPSAEELALLMPSLERDARIGYPSALTSLVFLGDRLGVPAAEWWAYRLGLQRIGEQAGRPEDVDWLELMLSFKGMGVRMRLSSEEERAARALAEDIARQHRAHFCEPVRSGACRG